MHASRWLLHGETIYPAPQSPPWFRPCSAAIARESLRDRERFLQPGRGEVVEDNFTNGFEELEVMPLFVDPEHHDSFERRTAGQAAGDSRHKNCGIRRKRKAPARPLPHPSQRLVACGVLLQRLNLGGRRHDAAAYQKPPPQESIKLRMTVPEC